VSLVAVAPHEPEPVRQDADLLRLGYQELLTRTAELARDASGADAAYVLVADEDGLLRMRAAVGRGIPEPPLQPPVGPGGMGLFLTVYRQLAESGPGDPADELPPSFLTERILVDGQVIGELAVMAAEPDRFTDRHSARIRGVAGRVAVPLERARLTELDRARRGQISFLAEASDLLAGTLDRDQAVALAAQLVVPRLATWCAVLLTGEDGAPGPVHVRHADEARSDALSCLLRRQPPPLAGPGEHRSQWSPMAIPGELPPEAAALAADQAWCFPLVARGRRLGGLIIGRPGAGALGTSALDLAEDLARRVALALDNARLYSDQRRASHALQRSLLPPRLPEISGLGVAAGYQAAGEGNEVGGDFYDIFPAGPGRWRFAIGDVCGKGLEAAAVTGLTRHALRILAREGHDVPAVLERLNSILIDEGSAVPFVTLIHGEIVVTARRAAVSLVCAGHPPPLLLTSDGAVRPAAGAQPLLGVLDQVAFEYETCELRPGDVLLCVTDGITERRCEDRLLDDDNGLQRLLGDCWGLSVGAIAARLQQQAAEFCPDPPADDMALLVFRGQPIEQPPAQPSVPG
jgi:serine phosphatase RsbU (regulator of sigma subunit)